METNELMYKNYVEHNGLIRQISGFRTYSTNHTLVRFEMSAGEYMVESLNPILLSEKWLLKAGFEHKSGNEYVKDRFIYRKSFSDLVINGYEFDYNGIICYPRYVHQLQNLYFALTGEELVFSSTEP